MPSYPVARKSWFLLTLFVSLLFWGLTWNTFPDLSSDDMGKDLYPFELTLTGHWPCRDYSWQYGPLMPVYYAFWLFLGGTNLISIRIGYAVIYLIAALLSHRLLCLFISPSLAFLASLAFLIQGLCYPYSNFNHIGGIPFLLAALFSLWKFFLTREFRWCYLGTLFLVLLAWVKWNMGMLSFFAFLVSLVFGGGFSEKRRLAWLPLIFGGLILTGYLPLFVGLPRHWVMEQCLRPGTEHGKSIFDLITPLKHLIQWYLVWDPKRLWWVSGFLILGLVGCLGLKRKGIPAEARKCFLPVLVSLFLFGLFNASEFLLIGSIYRLDFWSFPILLLLGGFLAQAASVLFNRVLKVGLWGLLFIGILYLPGRFLKEAYAKHLPERYLDFPRGRVYVTRESLSTVEAIKKGTHFIIENTRPHQKILSLPKDPLYCFLSGRQHAGPLLFLEPPFQISESEEREVIHLLEREKVPLVILSNRDKSNLLNRIPLMGYLGKTYGQELWQYVSKHYEETAAFGTWETENPRQFHAIKIFKRKG